MKVVCIRFSAASTSFVLGTIELDQTGGGPEATLTQTDLSVRAAEQARHASAERRTPEGDTWLAPRSPSR